MFMCMSRTNLSLFKRDIDELIDEFVEVLLFFFSHRRVCGGHMVLFSWRPGGLYCLYCLHEPEFRIYISLLEAKDKGVEIDTAVTRQMLDINVFIYGAVDLDEASTIKKLHQSIELQNALVRCTYTKLTYAEIE
ncbi:hypothetical protein Rs2_22525 [Raphanus sativus]|nr:hypothetical protein Rs2_22525 [Raphanus sativus]